MKPHKLADLANALTAVATRYGHQEQCRERILSVLVEHFAPEHGNRGPELETAVLVDARELEALRSDREALRANLRHAALLLQSSHPDHAFHYREIIG